MPFKRIQEVINEQMENIRGKSKRRETEEERKKKKRFRYGLEPHGRKTMTYKEWTELEKESEK